jgi:hypothetical protein
VQPTIKILTAHGVRQAVFHHWPWLALPVLAIPALRPFLLFGLQQSFDGATHLLRIALLDYHITHGTLFPRWLPEMMLGHGAPIFTYYASLSYYLAETFHLAGLDFTSAVAASMSLMVVVGGYGMFLFAHTAYNQRSPWPALVAATAYMYAPYVLTNVFIRGSIAEVGGLAMLPWVFWSARGLVCDRNPRRYVLPAVLSFAGLALVHNLTFFLAPPLLIAYLLILWSRERFSRDRLVPLGQAILLAAGLTAFFWLPVLFERAYVKQGVYKLAADEFLPKNVWRWNNFLDLHLQYNYNFGLPVQLGIVQCVLALAGATVLVRRRDREWIFLAGAALLIAALIGAWSLPIWQSNPMLLAVQFPWRLLSLISLIFALLTGGIVLALTRDPRLQSATAVLVLGLIVVAHAPQLAWLGPLPAAYADLTPARVAQVERDTGSPGGPGYTNEFTPLWASRDPSPVPQEPLLSPLQIALREAGPFALHGTVDSAGGGELRFGQWYFPGWQVTLDGSIPLPVRPAVRTGLITVSIPPGKHEISLIWAGTGIQRAAGLAGLLALAVIACWCWQYRRLQSLTFLSLVVLAVAVAGFIRPAPTPAVQTSPQPVRISGMELSGYRVERDRSDSLTIWPYWFVSQRQPEYRLRWQIRNNAGQVIGETRQGIYFDTARTSDYAAGTLLVDAVDMAVPPDLPAGRYPLYLQLDPDAGSASLFAGTLEIPAARGSGRQPVPKQAVQARFGTGMSLAGFDLTLNGKAAPGNLSAGPLVVNPGDVLRYALYWRADGPIEKDYQARVELVDQDGIGVSGLEQVAGGFLNQPTAWDAYRLRRDAYQVTVPLQAQGGLYGLELRVFDPVTGDLLPLTRAGSQELGENLVLGQAKVVTLRNAQPQHVASGRLGDFATFLGYDLQPASARLRAGEQVTVTLYYRADRTTPVDYTRTLQVVSPTLGMAVQADGYPQQGRNPTHAWVQGEVIADKVMLSLPPDSRPGNYALVLGFYDLKDNLRRLPLRDQANKPIPNNGFTLQSITVDSR